MKFYDELKWRGLIKDEAGDDLEDVIANYELEPSLTAYNYGTINNILNTKIIINYTNGKSIEYKLYIDKQLIGDYIYELSYEVI